MAERIIERRADEMYREDMIKYSIIVVRRRAFSEIRDGLKPVQRRALYDMYDLHATPGKARKSARITGDTIGRFHPHGDTSVYEAMETIANWWKCKIPLIQPASNFGTIMGSKPPAQRYTEVALSPFAMDCVFGDLDDTSASINWKENFDNTLLEPEYLPVKIPLLLINGSFGIGVATSNSNIPPHNPVEVIEATRRLLRDPNAEVILVPDHCDRMEIIDTDWKTISETGYGTYYYRGIIDIGTDDSGYPAVFIKSIPGNMDNTSFKERIYDLIEKKQLSMVRRVDDDSNNKRGIHITISLKKGSDPNYVRDFLYNKAGMRVKDTINFYAIDDVNPGRFSYKQYLLSFIDFRASTKFRVYCNRYKDNRTRCHKLETYIKVIESGEIENIVKMVRKQRTTDNSEIMEYLIKKLNITDIQANFILETNIRQLSRGYLDKYKAEYKRLISEQSHYRQAITDNGELILNEIDQELLEAEKKYGSTRKCKVIKEDNVSGIMPGTFKVILTNKNYLRKLADNEKINTIRGDSPKFVLRIDNTENILLFDNKGKVFKLPVSKIPLTDKSSAGTDIRILSRNLTADVILMCSENMIHSCVKGKNRQYMVVVTKGNVIKKLDMEDFMNVSLSGLLYTKLKDDSDEVSGITIAPEDLDVVIYSKQKALRTSVAEIPLFKRNASGSKAMDTDFDIEGISTLYPDVDTVSVVTQSGRLNLFPMNCLPSHKRARQGNNVIKLAKGDNIISIYGVDIKRDKLKLTTTEGVQEVPLDQFKMKSGVATGDKIPNLPGQVIKCDIIYEPKSVS